MKCALCQERKGKRGCKLTSAQFICPSCCASTRRAECDGCGYYQASEAYQREKQVEGRFQSAIDLFAQVLATQKDHVQSYGNMGLAYAILGNRQKALECLDRAIELDPEYEPAIVNRLSVASLKDGEALPDFDPRELNYYSEFKLRGKSYVQHLVDELKAGGK